MWELTTASTQTNSTQKLYLCANKKGFPYHIIYNTMPFDSMDSSDNFVLSIMSDSNDKFWLQVSGITRTKSCWIIGTVVIFINRHMKTRTFKKYKSITHEDGNIVIATYTDSFSAIALILSQWSSCCYLHEKFSEIQRNHSLWGSCLQIFKIGNYSEPVASI